MTQILPRYTQTTIHHDPLEKELARREAAEHQAREAIANGTNIIRNQVLNPRGWPIQTKGIGGTSPGTDPLAAYLAHERRQQRSRTRTTHDLQSDR